MGRVWNSGKRLEPASLFLTSNQLFASYPEPLSSVIRRPHPRFVPNHFKHCRLLRRGRCSRRGGWQRLTVLFLRVIISTTRRIKTVTIISWRIPKEQSHLRKRNDLRKCEHTKMESQSLSEDDCFVWETDMWAHLLISRRGLIEIKPEPILKRLVTSNVFGKIKS